MEQLRGATNSGGVSMTLIDRFVLGLFAFAMGYVLASAINATLVLAHWP